MPPSLGTGSLRATYLRVNSETVACLPCGLHQMLQRSGYYENSGCSDAHGCRNHHEIDVERSRVEQNYESWDDALKEAEQLRLINTVEATAAKALPPGFPLHTTTEMGAGNFANAGFMPGKTPPPQ
jgi:hypothetical protein